MTFRKLTRTSALTLTALAGGLWFAAPATATEGYTATSYLGGHGSGDGQFQGPTGVAVNEATGDLYIADRKNNRVQVFTSEGTYVSQFNGGPEHPLSEPTDIAVDNSTGPAKGDVYVFDRGHSVVDVFDSDGTYLRQLPVEVLYEKELHGAKVPISEVRGIAVDGSGDVWVSIGEDVSELGSTAVQEFDDTGSLVRASSQLTHNGGRFDENPQPGIAVDSQGSIYIDRSVEGVDKYNTNFEFVEELRTHLPASKEPATGVAVDALTGNVFVDEGVGVEECGPFGEPPSCEVGVFGAFEGMSGSMGIAVDASSGAVFVSEYAADRVAVFEVATVPVVQTGAASVVEREGATVLGTIKRGVKPSAYYVQYGVGGSLTSSTQPVGIPSEAEAEVHVSLTGLKAETQYSYRLVMEAEDGVHYYGKVETFTTLPAVEGVATGVASGVAATSARVTGALEPNGFDAHYYFRYGGEGEGYSLVSPALPGVDAGNAFRSVAAEADLSRLVPNTVYHFKLVAVNALGVTEGGEETLATPPVEPIAIVQPALLLGLHEATLSGVVNPEHSDTHYHFLFGTTTSYGVSRPVEEGDVGSSFGDRSVAVPVEGLAPGVTYHYALVASNSQGTVQSADMAFTTPTLGSLVPVVSTGAASEVSPNGARISGSVDPQGSPTSYEFDIGTDTTYGSRVLGEAGSGSAVSALSLSLQGLAAGTLYHYRLVASNRYGTVYGEDQTFTTPGFPTALLVSPVGAPLVPQPAFTPPSSSDAITVKLAPKLKHAPRHKAKKKRKVGKRGAARRARRARTGRGERGNGR
jgi:hypothetical protein